MRQVIQAVRAESKVKKGLAFDSLEEVVEEAGDGEWADAAEFWGDGGKIGAGADGFVEIAFNDAVFASSASVDKNGTRFDIIIRNQARDARSCYNYIKILKFCQVVATMEYFDVVARISKHFKEGGADKFAASD